MKLAGLRLYRYRLPLTEPLKGTTRREGLLVELMSDGGVAGWGEAAPLPGFSGESLEEVTGQLRGLADEVAGCVITDEWSGLIGLAPSARFGFELALWNLRAASSGKMLPELFSSRPRATVFINALISSPDHAFEEARRLRSAGYEAVKLKVGSRSVEEEVELVRVVCEALGDAVELRLDANRAWSLDEAGRFARATADLDLEYVEEPLAEPARMPLLAERYGLPVALDESLVLMEPEELEEHAYARAVVLKPTLLGGVSRTLRLARAASRLGMRTVISSSYETGVGTSALVALAAGVGEAPAGLDTYRRLAADVLRPRLELPAPRVDVRALFGERREFERRLLVPVG